MGRRRGWPSDGPSAPSDDEPGEEEAPAVVEKVSVTPAPRVHPREHTSEHTNEHEG